MLLIKIDRHNTTPIFNQVLYQLKEMIENKTLKPGDKLPATRKLSNNLGISRATVFRAYEELWAIGYIESKQGSYSTVREINKTTRLKTNRTHSLINWDRISTLKHINSEISEVICSTSNQNRNIINFVSLSPDPKLFPVHELRKCINQTLVNNGTHLLGYGNSMGYKPLREYISNHMHKHGIKATTDEIFITNGTQNS